MKAMLMPREVLLARFEVYQYRAWSRCWDASLAAIMSGDHDGSALKWFAELTTTPEETVREARGKTESLEKFLEAMAAIWASGPRDLRKIHKLPDGLVGVEPPVDLTVVCRFVQQRMKRESKLANLVTGDLRTLAQLQIAVEHAAGNEPILIMGETGTGKSALARAIHTLSGRETFHALNCSAIPAPLFESELFGHVQGAFTDAHKSREGLVEAAADGTLFLDEVGELAPEAQPKLLHLLREREYRRVGDTKVIKTSARFIAATNAELEAKIADENYRQDLFHRLNGCRIELPPLRERKGDIGLLVEHFLEKHQHEGRISESVESLLVRYPWPGNVAELETAMHHAINAANGRRIEVSHLPDDIVAATYPPRGTAAQVLLATDAAKEIAKDRVRDKDVLVSVLDDELQNPPPLGGDEEVDALVHAIVGLAALISKETRDKGAQGAHEAMAQVRTAALLAELRQASAEREYPAEMVAEIEGRLRKTLEDMKGVPLFGMITEVMTNVFGSDDPQDRSNFRQFARKLKRSGPLIAHAVLPAIQKALAQPPQLQQAGPAVAGFLPTQTQPPRYQKAPDTDWKDQVNKPAIEAAIRDSGGSVAGAAKKLKKTSSYVHKLVGIHGLKALVEDSRRAKKAERRTKQSNNQPTDARTIPKGRQGAKKSARSTKRGRR